MGLFDGKGGAGEMASTAHVAKLLDAPVVLVVDARAMARSAAAMVHGYATFDRDLRLAGVVLNRVGSATHEGMLREALRPLGIPVLGVLRRDPAVSSPDRHLGLVPVAERRAGAKQSLEVLGAEISRSLDLGALVRLASSARPLTVEPWSPKTREKEGPDVRIAVASGPSFSFLYEENVELLRAAGAEVLFFDPTSDEGLPEGTDALYLGGGFPETNAGALSANEPMKEAIRRLTVEGRPVVAECGGLLYLSRELDGEPMCGVLDTAARMTDRLTLGYREARAAQSSPLANEGTEVRGHEFHYSSVEPRAGESPAWDLAGRGAEGFIGNNVHASYLHTHWAAFPELPRRFVRAAKRTVVRT